MTGPKLVSVCLAVSSSEAEHVAVAAVVASERIADEREGGTVFQQEAGRAECAGGEDEAAGLDCDRLRAGCREARPAVFVLGEASLDVGDAEARLERREARDLARGANVGRTCGLFRAREVGLVERVLASVVAADVALAAEPARGPREPVEIAVAVVELEGPPRFGLAGRGEGHRDLRLLHGHARRPCRLREGPALGRGRRPGVLLRPERLFGEVVEGIEVR